MLTGNAFARMECQTFVVTEAQEGLVRPYITLDIEAPQEKPLLKTTNN